MKKRKAWRYMCEFCKKSNCSAPSIRKHESRCTLNPERHCGMCDIACKAQPSMADLLASLPLRPTDKWPDLTDEQQQALRAAADDCPACIMAALRQSGWAVACMTSFDFKKECESVLAEFRAMKHEEQLATIGYAY